jgi:fucose 4-O-acetylase-like acetyltransferase
VSAFNSLAKVRGADIVTQSQEERDMRGLGGLARRIDQRTPDDRDRYLDFLRVGAITLVILGHWIVRVILEGEDGLHAEYLLEIRPHWQWATLLVQVMPVFFFVGGLVNARSWRKARDAGETPTGWISRRARRLLFPLIVFVMVMTGAALLVDLGPGHDALILDLDVALIPLWFLAIYLVMICLTPATLSVHTRGASLALIGALLVAAFVADILRFTADGAGLAGFAIGGQPAIAAVNFLLIWVAIHQLGYFWADDSLPHTSAGQWGLLAIAAALLAAMIGPGFHPLTMVPVEGTVDANNAAPPTTALFALALVQLAIVLLLRRPMARLLRHPAVWAPVAVAGPLLMSLCIWHQAVMVAMAHVVHPLGLIPLTASVDALWWATRPLWVLWCAVPLVLVVLLVRPLEKSAEKADPANRKPWAIGVGIALFSGGIGLLILRGLHDAAMPLNLPWPALIALAAGMFALGAIRRSDMVPVRRR